MSLAVSSELDAFSDAVRRHLREQVPLSAIRARMEGSRSVDESAWRSLAEVGVHSLGIPEQYGGSGADLRALGLAFEEAGRALYDGPLLSTLGLASGAILASGDTEAGERFLPEIAGGRLVAGLAYLAPGTDWSTFATATASQGDDGTWNVDGDFGSVVDGCLADVLFAYAETDGGGALFAIPADGRGVERRDVSTLDQTRGIADVVLRGAQATLVGSVGEGRSIVHAALDRAYILLAAEMVGGTEACLQQSVSYAKQRVQFGRVIGSFQAIKHKCAEIQVALEGARACARYAAWSVVNSPAEVSSAAVLSKANASTAFFRAAGENVQIHGGLGFTWEHDAHLYLKRAKADSLLFGSVTDFRLRLADLIGF